MNLSVILPCFNEEANIEHTVRDVVEWFRHAGIEGEIVVVNDGSTDGTAEVLKRLCADISRLRVIQHPVNRGYGAAVRSGCDAALGDLIAFMDSDGQFRAEDFGLLLPHLDRYVFVTGRRKKRADPFMRTVNAKLFGLLSFAVLGIWVRDVNCAMKVFRRDIWSLIRPTHATGALVNAEMFFRLKQNGIPWYQVDVHHYPRTAGAQTGANLTVIFRMFRELFALKKAPCKRHAAKDR